MPYFGIGQKAPTFGQGALLGLGGGLQQLASDKLTQVRQQNEQRQLSQTLQKLNLSPQEQGDLINVLPPEQRLNFLHALAGLNPAQQQAQQQQVRPTLEQEPTITAAAQEQRAQELRPQQPNVSSANLGNEVNKMISGSEGVQNAQLNPNDIIKQLTALGQKPNSDQAKKIKAMVEEMNANPEKLQQAQAQYEQAVKNNDMVEFRRPGYQGPAVPLDQAISQSQPGSRFSKPLTSAQQLSEQRAERKERVAEEKEDAKETKQFYLDTTKQAEAAEKSEKRLDRMEELIDKGSLPFSTFYNLQKNLSESQAFKSIPVLGGILDSLTHGVGFGLREIQRNVTSRDIEEFEKLSNQFIDQAKAMFGNRITDADLKAYMATVPTLSNSDAGKKQIIGSIHAANEASKIKNKAMRDIIRENGNKRPRDLEILVEDRTKDQLDNLAKDFIHKPTLSIFNPPANKSNGNIWSSNQSI